MAIQVDWALLGWKKRNRISGRKRFRWRIWKETVQVRRVESVYAFRIFRSLLRGPHRLDQYWRYLGRNMGLMIASSSLAKLLYIQVLVVICDYSLRCQYRYSVDGLAI